MQSLPKYLGVAALAFALSACQPPKPEPVKPTALQQTLLEKLHKRCFPASRGQQGSMTNMPRHRKQSLQFTCDEMKLTCENDYASDLCKGMMVVASVENAHQRACRTSVKASRSAACSKLGPCNRNGFESPECAAAIAKYNY